MYSWVTRMAEVRRHPPVLDYGQPCRSERLFWESLWLDVVLDVMLVLVAGCAVAALFVIIRILVVLTSCPSRLFGVPW